MKKIIAGIMAVALVFGSAVSTSDIAVLDDTAIKVSAENSEKAKDDVLLRNKLCKMNYDEAIEFLNSYYGGIYAEKYDTRAFKLYIYKTLFNENNEITDQIYAKRYNDFLYAEENGKTVILGYIGENTSVNIPESINGLPVKAISTHFGMYCFWAVDDKDSLAGLGGGDAARPFIRRNDLSELNIYIPESVERIIERTDPGCIINNSIFGTNGEFGDDIYNTLGTNYPIRLTYAENSPIEKYLKENADSINLGENVTYGVGNPFVNVTGKVNVANRTTGLKVENLSVNIAKSGSDKTDKTVEVGSDGKFTVEGLADGMYDFTFSADKCVPRTYSVSVSNGTFKLDSVELHLYGDINGDGKITTADVGKANADARNSKKLTNSYDKKVADANGDGKITTADVGKVNAHVRNTKRLW